jgi:hypothetical protein
MELNLLKNQDLNQISINYNNETNIHKYKKLFLGIKSYTPLSYFRNILWSSYKKSVLLKIIIKKLLITQIIKF